MIEDKDLETILAQVMEEVKCQTGRVNLAEIGRRTGISRERLRKWKRDGFRIVKEKTGRPLDSGMLGPFKDRLDELLRQGVSNAVVCHERLSDLGFKGGKTIVKDYISSHRDMIPARRKLVADPQGSRGMRYYTEPGDCFQMDWGFLKVEDTRAARGDAPVSRWSVTIAVSAMSSSFPMRSRRTCSSGCAMLSWRWEFRTGS